MKSRIAEIITTHSTFEIITHESPDEDAVGSSRALGQALVSLGKDITFVYPTPIPAAFQFTAAPESGDINEPEISVLVDVSDVAMLKDVRPRGKVVVIDHHRTGGGLDAISWIDPEKSSASEMIYELLCELEIRITPEIAANLYMGLFGDTGGFIHANTTARVFQLAYELTCAGADPHLIAYRIRKAKPYAFYQILSIVMQRMIIKGGVFGSYISYEELKKIHARPEDASGIIEEISSLAGSVLVMFLREVSPETVHCSIRSKNSDAALKTACAFGGGGHAMAAGFTVSGKPKELIQEVLKEGQKWVETA
jgi:bifunctional oligoribonuclease and PAP phosphatase NrnA